MRGFKEIEGGDAAHHRLGLLGQVHLAVQEVRIRIRIRTASASASPSPSPSRSRSPSPSPSTSLTLTLTPTLTLTLALALALTLARCAFAPALSSWQGSVRSTARTCTGYPYPYP